MSELEDILADEQACLLSGDYSGLADLADRKTELAERLAVSAPVLERRDVNRLSDKAEHNEALLNSAQRGIQAAISQLKQFSDGEHQSTYSREGERRSLSQSHSSVIQKF